MKLIMIRQMIIPVSLLLGAVAWAQDSPEDHARPPYVSISVARQPASAFQDVAPAAELENKEHRLTLGVRRFLVGNAALDIAIDYQYTRYEYEGIRGRNRDLHRLQIPVALDLRRNAWRINGYVAPGISTSSNVFKDFLDRGGSDDVLTSARVEGRRTSADTNWIIGLAYDRSFGKAGVYPIAGLGFSLGDSLDLRLAFPDTAFVYRWADRHSILGRIFPAGHQWHVVSDETGLEFDYRVRAIRSQLNWNIRLWRQVSVDLSAGYEFARHHDFVDDRGERIRSGIADQWLIAIGLRVGSAPLPATHRVPDLPW